MNARVTDPALLHYRDTAFQLMRSRMHGYSFEETIEQLMRSYVVSKYDKATGGRHKALGDPDLNIIPSTSTISSHFPRAVGLASSIPLNKRLKTTGRVMELGGEVVYVVWCRPPGEGGEREGGGGREDSCTM